MGNIFKYDLQIQDQFKDYVNSWSSPSPSPTHTWQQGNGHGST